MGALLSREKLAAILARLESPFDGERAAAGLLASRMIRAAGLAWSDVILPPPAVAARPPPDPPKPSGWRATVAACRARPDRLTAWEIGFLAEIAGYRHEPSEKQMATLDGIARRVLRW